jgi:hypothetical protein
MVRLGSLMEDLECYIDNSLVFGEDGKIIARKGGIRRYIQSEIPDLYKSYKTLMRYKALARRFRQAVGIADPVPAASVLPEDGENMMKRVGAKVGADAEMSAIEHLKSKKIATEGGNMAGIEDEESVENMVRTNSRGGVGDGCGEEGERGSRAVEEYGKGRIRGAEDGGKGEVGGNEEVKKDGRTDGIDSRHVENGRLNDEVRKAVREILDVCEGTFLDLAAVLALRICEDTIPHKSYKGTSAVQCG